MNPNSSTFTIEVPHLITADGPRWFGRDTQSTMRDWAKIEDMMPRAPRPLRGAVPDVSPLIENFDPRIPWYQQRGFCVGWTAAMLGMIISKIPPGATSDTPPLPTHRFSPIFSYDVSRMEARDEGINLGFGDGSIVSAALKAAAKYGFCLWETDPSDPQYEGPHKNGTVPDRKAFDEAKLHIGGYALCDDFEHGLELVGAGIPVNLGTNIPQGFMRTDAKGWITLRGMTVGGHSYRLMGFNKKEDWGLLGNNWPTWGRRHQGDESYMHMQYYDNLAYVSLTDLAALCSNSRVRSGAVEIGAINKVAGFGPLLMDFTTL
jgi:hypothetical protein